MNWAYWGSVGVVASDDYRSRMAAAGIGSIEPEEGMRALRSLLAGPLTQVAFLKAAGGAVVPGEAAGRIRVLPEIAPMIAASG